MKEWKKFIKVCKLFSGKYWRQITNFAQKGYFLTDIYYWQWLRSRFWYFNDWFRGFDNTMINFAFFKFRRFVISRIRLAKVPWPRKLPCKHPEPHCRQRRRREQPIRRLSHRPCRQLSPRRPPRRCCSPSGRLRKAQGLRFHPETFRSRPEGRRRWTSTSWSEKVKKKSN